MQLRAPGLATAIVAAALSAPGAAAADDGVDANVTWYQEQRQGGLGGLTVIPPQVDGAVDVAGDILVAVESSESRSTIRRYRLLP